MNGTLNVADESSDKFYILIQNYANLTVTDMTLDGTNLDKWSTTDGDSYVLSNNSGTVVINGETNIIANNDGDKAVAIDACLYKNYAAPTVTINTTGTISGTVEVTGGALTVEQGTFNVVGTQCFDVFVCSSGSLTINAGTITGGKKSLSTAVWAKDNGIVVINGGTFTIDAEEGDYNDLIYAKDNAKITVYGGHFSGVYSEELGSNFLLNIKNGSAAQITVYGGTFVDFNPGNSGTEPGANNNFCAEGYGPTDLGNGTYGVHEHVAGEVVVENDKAPTCTKEGSYDNVVYCTVCNAELSRETITVDKIAHTPAAAVEENRVESTCTVAGSYESVVYCSVCGEELSRETKALELAAHTPGETVVENKVDATCTAEGSYDNVVYCTECGAELSRETITVDKIAHDYEAVVTAPTCTEKGYTTYTCACGDSYTADETAALGHTEEKIPGKDATCEEDGWTEGIKCSTCEKELLSVTPIPATGHNMQLAQAEVAAGCLTDGYTAKYACANNCGKTEGGVKIPATGHTEEVDAAKAPTCTETGLTEGKHCSVCKEVLVKQEVVDALAHNYEVTDFKNATCTEDGYVTYTCQNDATHTYTEEIKATGHNYVDGACSVCGEADPDAAPDFIPNFGESAVTTEDKEKNVLVTTFQAGTGANAPMVTITSPEGGWTLGEDNDFTVSSAGDVACVVIVKSSVDGKYYRLDATTAEDGTHTFTLDETFTENCELIVAVKGDIDGDGVLLGREVSKIKAEQLGNTANFTELQMMIADVDGDGALIGREVSKIKAAQLGNAKLDW